MRSGWRYKAFRLAVRRWGAKPEELVSNLDRAAKSMGSAKVSEMTGLYLLAEKNYPLAIEKFTAAKANWKEPADKLRQDLHIARARVESGDTATAVKLLRRVALEHKGKPGESAATALANQLDPPPPPAPKAP